MKASNLQKHGDKFSGTQKLDMEIGLIEKRFIRKTQQIRNC